MPYVDITVAETDKAFVQIASANVEGLIKQLTLDEKVALLTGRVSLHTTDLHRYSPADGFLWF